VPTEATRARSLAWWALGSALVGQAAFLYTARFGDTLLGVTLAYACGPLAVALGVAAWWRGRERAVVPRFLTLAAVVLAVLLMAMIGYVLWWVTTRSAAAT
jgi:hypothetical protein